MLKLESVRHAKQLINLFSPYGTEVVRRCYVKKVFLKISLNSQENNCARISFLTLICIKWLPGDPSKIFLVTIFAQKVPERSGSMYSSILMLENIWHHHFSWSEPNSQEIANLLQFSSGPPGTKIGTKFTVFCEFSPLQEKWRWHMFSNMK